MLCDDLEGWDGGGGREIQEGGDMADSLFFVQQKIIHCRAIKLNLFFLILFYF